MASKLFLICSFCAIVLMVLAFASAAPEETVEGRQQQDPEKAEEEVLEAADQGQIAGVNKGSDTKESDDAQIEKWLKEKSRRQKTGVDRQRKSYKNTSGGGIRLSEEARKADIEVAVANYRAKSNGVQAVHDAPGVVRGGCYGTEVECCKADCFAYNFPNLYDFLCCIDDCLCCWCDGDFDACCYIYGFPCCVDCSPFWGECD